MPSYDAATLGQLGYQAYGAATDNRTYDDRPMPTWDGLGETIQEAWTMAAATIAAAHEQTLAATGDLPAAPASTRAKFRCVGFTTTRWDDRADETRAFEFQAQYDPDQPEDQRYAKATPIGKLTITVDNPAVTFEPGQAYYLDITLAD